MCIRDRSYCNREYGNNEFSNFVMAGAEYAVSENTSATLLSLIHISNSDTGFWEENMTIHEMQNLNRATIEHASKVRAQNNMRDFWRNLQNSKRQTNTRVIIRVQIYPDGKNRQHGELSLIHI